MARAKRKGQRADRNVPGATEQTGHRLMTAAWMHAALIVVLGLLLYANTLSAPFVFDDYNYIVDNPVIRDLAYFADSSRMDSEEVRSRLVENHATRLVVFLTFAVNYLVHGLDVTGYHVVNILIHLVTALLVWQLVLMIMRTPFLRSTEWASRYGGLLALLAGLLFVSHPVQTQAVTYLSQRFTSLAALFYLLSILLYVRSRIAVSQPAGAAAGGETAPAAKLWSSAPFVCSLLAALAAMKTKEISFTLPLMIALCEFLFFEGRKRTRLLYLLPLMLTLLVIPLTLLGDQEVRVDIAALERSLSADGENRALTYLLTQFRVVVTYLRLLVLPAGQTFDYDYQAYTGLARPVLLSLLFLMTLFGAAVYFAWRSGRGQGNSRRWMRLLAFGIFWFFLALSIESSILPLEDLIFEHRLYLPSVGFFLGILAATGFAFERFGSRAVKGIAVVLAVVVAAWSVATVARNSVWSDAVALYADNALKSPNKPRPHQNLGFAYMFRGRYQDARKEFDTALQIHQRLMQDPQRLPYAYYPHRIDDRLPVDRLKRLREESATIHNNLGAIYEQMGRLDDAEKEYGEAIRLWNNLASAHSNLGNVYKQQQRLDKAVAASREAVRIDPWFAEYHFNLGNAYATRGDYADAAAAYEKALALDPAHAKAREHLADVRMRARSGPLPDKRR